MSAGRPSNLRMRVVQGVGLVFRVNISDLVEDSCMGLTMEARRSFLERYHTAICSPVKQNDRPHESYLAKGMAKILLFKFVLLPNF